jgi:hypothetical protein
MIKGTLVKITYINSSLNGPYERIYYVEVIRKDGHRIKGRVIHSVNSRVSPNEVGDFSLYDAVEPTTYDEIMLEEL